MNISIPKPHGNIHKVMKTKNLKDETKEKAINQTHTHDKDKSFKLKPEEKTANADGTRQRELLEDEVNRVIVAD